MSKRAYFGTDGIRGQANKHPMTAEVALRVGWPPASCSARRTTAATWW
jgi:phosphomannomutase